MREWSVFRGALRGSAVLVVAFLAMVSGLPATGGEAFGHGPGAHLREADRTLELLMEVDAEWAALAESELARSYLRLGSIAPDFQWISGALTFGHAKSLSYHLVDVSEELEPRFRLFALGHLAHILSDANAEMFLTPTVFGTVPMGLLNIFEGQEDLQAESETLCEGFGDMLFGDWVGVVDLIYDFYLEGEEAVARAEEILLWYCAEGASFHGRVTDCDRVLADILGALGTADSILPPNRRDGETAIMALVGGSARSVLNVFAGGFLGFLLGTDTTPSRIHERELERVRRSPLGERRFWTELYEEHFLDLAPRWTVDHLRTRSTAWPDWEPRGIIAGNIQSMMGFVEEYDVVPGLLVDEIVWRDAAGDRVTGLERADAGRTFEVSVRLYSTMPWTGTIRAVVRGDREGLSRAEDPVVGEASFALEIDPMEYTERPRDVLRVPFTVEPDGVLGFYLELSVDGGSGPFFTTSVDRFWGIAELDLDEPIYRDNLRTYGGFPESLPVVDAMPGTGILSVKVLTGPAGFGLPGVEVRVDEWIGETGAGGHVVVDRLAPGPVRVEADGGDLVEPLEETVAVESGEHRWLVLRAARRPSVSGPAGWRSDARCASFTWNASDFGGVHEGVQARLVSPDGATVWAEEELGPTVRRICGDGDIPDGSEVVVSVRPMFPGPDGGRYSVMGTSPSWFVDSSPPEVVSSSASWTWSGAACGAPEALSVTLELEEPHAPLEAGLWRVVGARDVRDVQVTWSREGVGWSGVLSIPAPSPDRVPRFEVGARNAAGLEGWAEVAVPEWAEGEDCPAGDPVSSGADVQESDPEPGTPGTDGLVEEDVGADVEAGGAGCGCVAARGGSSGGWMAGLLWGLLLWRRRRRGRGPHP
ncbi:MAG: hypothetical protein EA398_00960 [Deltaproteobacteria bacterium]|nr:MAG: hypothetical protein EA398_00960 [Deltaproteobacteria bacterium]